jgi:hypothetical protein
VSSSSSVPITSRRFFVTSASAFDLSSLFRMPQGKRLEQTCCKFGPSGSEFSRFWTFAGQSNLIGNEGTRFSLLQYKSSRIGGDGIAVLSIGAALVVSRRAFVHLAGYPGVFLYARLC